MSNQLGAYGLPFVRSTTDVRTLLAFPRYAFLPGRHPHPIRDVGGHSRDLKVEAPDIAASDTIRWGFDLFSNGYYWEAHEAWEGVWSASSRNSQQWILMKGLILLAASGLKLRTSKAAAASRHASRASALLRLVVGGDAADFEMLCGIAPSALADLADEVVRSPSLIDASIGAPPETVAPFMGLDRQRKVARCLQGNVPARASARGI